MSAVTWIAVALLGGAGAVARFLLTALVIRERRAGGLELGTLIVNLSGAFALGLLAGVGLSGEALLLAGTATLGAYTTFSTWILEIQRLAEGGARRAAVVHVALTIGAGVGAAELGRLLGG